MTISLSMTSQLFKMHIKPVSAFLLDFAHHYITRQSRGGWWIPSDFQSPVEIGLKKEVNGLKIQLDNLEQYSRRNCLVINGIPEVSIAYQTTIKRRAESEDQVNPQEVHSEMSPNIPPLEESSDQILLELFRTKLNIDVNIKDIDRSHRLGHKQLTSRDKPRPIICKFMNYNTCQAVFKARRNLKGSHTTTVENLTARKIVILMKAHERFGAVRGVKTKFESVEAVEKA